MVEFEYDRADIHLRYEQARALPPDTIRLWMETISACLHPRQPQTIIDLGCGTGRFTGALARHFQARVLGVDPSLGMLQCAPAAASRADTAFVRGTAEQLPFCTASADVVFISMAYHHLHDKTRAAHECRRVLRNSGSLCIRTSTVESMDSYLWLKFFPAAHGIELHRAPTRPGLDEFMRSAGFTLSHHTIVHQRFADNHADYAQKIGQRGLSSLQQIPDNEFRQGLAQLEAHCHATDPAQPVYEDIDLFVFAKLP